MDKLIEALTMLRDAIDGVGRATVETANNPKWRYHRDTPHMKTMAGVYAEWAAAVQVIIDNLPALSHAAGQDGQQCRAASGEIPGLDRLISDCKSINDRVFNLRYDRQTGERLALYARLLSFVIDNETALRALSRGVPEGK